MSAFMTDIVKNFSRRFELLVVIVCAFFSAVEPSLATPLLSEDYLKDGDYIEFIYDSHSSLGMSAANTIAQTSDGFIWVGTYSGLSRFDGSEFEIIPPSLGVRSVSDLFVDSKGRLWVGTNDNGVALYQEGKFTFWTKKDGLSSNTVRSIEENDDGKVFVATTGGLHFIDEGVLHLVEDPRLRSNYIFRLSKSLNNKVAGLTVRGDFFVLNGIQIETWLDKSVFSFGTLTSIEADPERADTYWVGTTRHTVATVMIRRNVFEIEQVLDAKGMDNINDVYKLGDRVYVSSDSGAGFFDLDCEFRVLTNHKFNSSIDKIMLDYEGNVWMTSSRQGVAKLTKNIFKSLLTEKRVVNGVSGRDGSLFVATDSGLIIQKNGELVENELTKMLDKSRVRQIYKDRQENLWISTYSKYGLVKYDPQGKISNYTSASGLPSSRVRVALEAENGNIYVGTRSGLGIIRGETVIKSYSVKDGLPNSQILCLLESDGKIYAGTDGGGIAVFENERITKIVNENDGLSTGVILRMTADPDGKRIWVSSSTSLGYYEDGKITNVVKFPSCNNFDILFTGTSDMLITSNEGVFITTSEKLRKEGGYNELLGLREGMGGTPTANSFNYVDERENIYLCLHNGLCSFNLGNVSIDIGNKKMCIPNVVMDGREVYFDKNGSVTLPRDMRRLSVKGYALSNTLNSLYLSVFLEGFDEKPDIYDRHNNREKTYTNLPGGTYKLHVGLYNPKTNTVASEVVRTIVKEKKFHEDPVIIGAVVFVFSLMLYLLYTWRVNVRLRRLRERERETRGFLDQVINSFAVAIDFKDHYTQGHSKRVAGYAKLIARSMGYSKERVDAIHRIAMLHDVGKVLIPDEILNKRGSLTDEEYAQMKRHTDIGAQVLSNITQFPEIAIGARTHHERFDGRGYGAQLKGKDIPIEGRIIAVADTFDAMNSNRVYRPHLTADRIISELHRAKNTQLDGEIVDVLLSLIEKGDVKIEDGEETTVSSEETVSRKSFS